MKNRKRKQPAKAAVRSRRFAITAICVTAVIVAGAAITVLSKQLANNKRSIAVSTKAASANAGKKYVTVKVAGRDVQVDPQTGQIKPLTPAEAHHRYRPRPTCGTSNATRDGPRCAGRQPALPRTDALMAASASRRELLRPSAPGIATGGSPRRMAYPVTDMLRPATWL